MSAAHPMLKKLTRQIPRAHIDQTLGEVEVQIRKEMKHLETVHYIYVIDPNEKLLGVFSIKDLFRFPPKTRVEKIYKKDHLITARPEMTQERVAYLAVRHGIKAVPIVDKNQILLGILSGDALLQIIYHEFHKDFLQLAGVHHGHTGFDNILTISLWHSIRHRVPWLLLGLIGGVFAAKIIGFFEATLSKNLLLAAFIPLIVYMGDAVGTQMEAFIIRDLAIDQKLPFLRYLLKQLGVIFLIGLFFGIALFGVGVFLYQDFQLGCVLGFALFLAIISSVLTGLIVPYLFNLFKMDPANASGPIATIVQDLLSIIIYFVIATWLL